jgi:hypothetical protein
MPTIEDYGAIAKRLRELQAAGPKGPDKIIELEQWRDLARQTVREYVQSRRRPRAGRLILPNRPIRRSHSSPRGPLCMLPSRYECDDGALVFGNVASNRLHAYLSPAHASGAIVCPTIYLVGRKSAL